MPALGALWSHSSRPCRVLSVGPGSVLGALGCWHDLWALESSQVLLPSPATNPQTLLSCLPAASAESTALSLCQ